MIQDIAPHVFHNEYLPRPMGATDAVVCCEDSQILLNVTAGDTSVTFPHLSDFSADEQVHIANSNPQYLFSIDETGYFSVSAQQLPFSALQQAQPQDASQLQPAFRCASGQLLRFCPVQIFRQQPDNATAHAIMVAYHLTSWMARSRFCGRCGAKTAPHPKERAMQCSACGNLIYPQISPAVAVAVVDLPNDRILLAKGLGEFRKFALIAGFVEIGETVEECVRREVFEEVGLKLGALHYYKSQPWGLTSIEMLGFFAELSGSDALRLQETEIAEARWFSREQLSEAPVQSLSFTLIEAFRTGEYLRYLK